MYLFRFSLGKSRYGSAKLDPGCRTLKRTTKSSSSKRDFARRLISYLSLFAFKCRFAVSARTRLIIWSIRLRVSLILFLLFLLFRMKKRTDSFALFAAFLRRLCERAAATDEWTARSAVFSASIRRAPRQRRIRSPYSFVTFATLLIHPPPCPSNVAQSRENPSRDLRVNRSTIAGSALVETSTVFHRKRSNEKGDSANTSSIKGKGLSSLTSNSRYIIITIRFHTLLRYKTSTLNSQNVKYLYVAALYKAEWDGRS